MLTPLGTKLDEGWEGCLSVTGMRGLVPRHRELHYRGVDAPGQRFDRTVPDFHVRVMQHEVDQLDGTLYPRGIRELTPIAFGDALVPREILADN